MSPRISLALVATILSLLLAFVVWRGGRNDRLSRAFVAGMLSLALFSLTSVLSGRADSLERAVRYNRISNLLQTPVILTFLYYMLHLTGFERKPDEKVMGLRIRHHVLYVVLFSLAIPVAFLTPGLIVERYVVLPGGSISYTTTPLIWVFILGTVVLLVLAFGTVRKAWLTEQDPVRHRFLRRNVPALVLIFFVAPTTGLILPKLGVHQATIALDISFMLAALLFTMAILRYQFDKVDQLNIGLEQKVRERTRELREAQTRLVQAGRMAGIGRLAAGLAHELNTPLGALGSAAQTLRRGLGGAAGEGIEERKRAALLQSAASAAAAADRIERVVKRLRSFVRLDEAPLQEDDLSRLAAESVASLQADWPAGVQLQQSLEPAPVRGRPAELNQVIRALLDNSLEALGEEGRLRIACGAEGDIAWLELEDDGPGIPPEVLERIYEPGTTTKGVKVGTGLGLAIAWQVMEQHGGGIEIWSEPGQGTNVRLELPLGAPAAKQKGGEE